MTTTDVAGPMTAAAFPDGQPDPDGPRPPGQVRQAALVAARHGGGWHGTVWTGGGRRGRRELKPHRRLLHGHFHEADPTGGWE